MSLVLINSHFGNLLNHMQILTEKTWTQTQGVENLENVVFFVFLFFLAKKCIINYKYPALVEKLTYSDRS